MLVTKGASKLQAHQLPAERQFACEQVLHVQDSNSLGTGCWTGWQVPQAEQASIS